MNKKKIFGIVLGLVGFLVPLVMDIPGLGFAGQIALAIFLLAACFWLLEPVPIYTTSLLVIFLEVLLLSKEGPLYQFSGPPTGAVSVVSVEPAGTTFRVPATAITEGRQIFVAKPGGTLSALPVELLEERGNEVLLRANGVTTNTMVITATNHWQTTYKPPLYREFFASMADPIIILFLGGCLLANASVKYGLDLSLTRLFLKPVGTKPSMILLGLLLATAVLSAFMSNTATTAMMMTVVLPILARLSDGDRLRAAVVLAIPIGANIGGIATPIGTPPNAIALSALAAQGISIPFAKWVVLALPMVAIGLLLSWVLLLKMFPTQTRELRIDLKGEFNRSPKAIVLYATFGVTALLWFTEQQHGIKSTMVAFLPVVVLPMLGVVGKTDIRSLPWEVFWLMAGGISLGIAIRETGLATWMVGSIEWGSLGSFAIMAGLALVSYAMANFLSHTVTVTLLAPIAVSVATVAGSGTGLNLTTTMIAIAVASSFGMALPISTPPNAIAMSSGMLENRDLLKAGSTIGILGMVLVLLMTKFFWPFFG